MMTTLVAILFMSLWRGFPQTPESATWEKADD
jgi:hypothetical protein